MNKEDLIKKLNRTITDLGKQRFSKYLKDMSLLFHEGNAQELADKLRTFIDEGTTLREWVQMLSKKLTQHIHLKITPTVYIN